MRFRRTGESGTDSQRQRTKEAGSALRDNVEFRILPCPLRQIGSLAGDDWSSQGARLSNGSGGSFEPRCGDYEVCGLHSCERLGTRPRAQELRARELLPQRLVIGTLANDEDIEFRNQQEGVQRYVDPLVRHQTTDDHGMASAERQAELATNGAPVGKNGHFNRCG